MSKNTVEKVLNEHNQIKFLNQISELTDLDYTKLNQQLIQIPWEEYPSKNPKVASQSITPTESFSQSRVVSLQDRVANQEQLNNLGLAAYKNGEVAVLMVAGGQGTRLGFAGPKGCFKIGTISGKSLYQIHSEKILAISLRFGQRIPFLIMTSAATDAETRKFFEINNRFGLATDQVEFFQQASIPCLDLEGNLLLAAPGELLTGPDGHGGCFTALAKSGLLIKLKTQGIKHLVYIQVDNVLAPVFDPYLIGLALSDCVEVITKVVEKTKPEEKVGLLVSVATTKVIERAGRQVTVSQNDTIKEYIELPQDLLEDRDVTGKLKYRFGNTAMHYWSVDFLERKYREGYKLPLHPSKKPLEAWKDGEIKKIEGFKYERFIFDLIPEATSSIGLEVDRNCEFAPLKNSSGSDSPASVNQLCSNLYRNWLVKSGVSLSGQVEVEISPLLAMDIQTLKSTIKLDPTLTKNITANTKSIFLD